MRRKPEARNARCLAGVLLLTLLSGPLAAADDAVMDAMPTAQAVDPAPTAAVQPQPQPQPAALTETALAEPLVGPLSLTLGAQVTLALGDGWRWVDKAQLKAYLAATGRSAGAWDLGLALSPGEQPQEFRLQFEPMGRVETGAPEAFAPEALMTRLQDLAARADQRRRAQGQPELAINGWAQSPALELEGQRLIWAEHRLAGADERLGWHGRLRLRSGVVKLDLVMPSEQWDVLGPQARALFESLAPAPGQSLAEAQDNDKRAPVDLPALVVDGVFGRGALMPGSEPEEGGRLGLKAALWVGAGLALAALALWGWRTLQAWRLQQIKDRLDEARLAQLEKDLGGRAEDVEEIVEDEDAPQA